MDLPSPPNFIWQLSDRKNIGPTVVILGGTHGDETGGIAVVRLLLARFGILDKPSGTYSAPPDIHGNLFIGFGNPEAMIRGTRAASNGRDLNRSFAEEELSHPPSADDRLDLVRARSLAPLLACADFLFDLHSTSSPSEPFVCVRKFTAAHEPLVKRLPIRYILTDPDEVYVRYEGAPGPCTTDDFVGRERGVALCFETGWAKDTERTEQLLANLVSVLSHIGSMEPRYASQLAPSAPDSIPSSQTVYAIQKPIELATSSFTYASGMDHGWQFVNAGQIVGHDATGHAVTVPHDGMYVFPTAPEKLRIGHKIAWLAQPVKDI